MVSRKLVCNTFTTAKQTNIPISFDEPLLLLTKSTALQNLVISVWQSFDVKSKRRLTTWIKAISNTGYQYDGFEAALTT